jgi:hypothetical protein
LSYTGRDPSLESIDLNESAIIAAIVRMNRKTMSYRDGVAKRGQHGKDHGCVKATFTVLQDLPQDLRQGVFRSPHCFDALIRFSNGTWYDDRIPDVRGMAIKLVHVTGDRLLPMAEDEPNQDFILVDYPVFFAKSMAEYLVFNDYFTKMLDFLKNWKSISGFFPRLFGYLQGAFMLQVFHAGLLQRSRAFASRRLVSLLATNYWSTTPYLLGSAGAVKYMARSLFTATDAAGGVETPDGLTEALRNDLRSSAASFEFGVHRQGDPETHPIEDTTKDWHADPQRFIPLAKIDIPPQEIFPSVSAQSLAERLSFSPWNGLVEHLPLGSVNRARRDVYLTMSKLRHEANGISTVPTL